MRRAATRRPVRLTESKLRQIIRETIEEELIQEGKAKQAALAALAAYGLTAGMAGFPTALQNVTDAIHNAVNTRAVHSAHINSLEGQEGDLNKLGRTENRPVTGHPTLKKAAQRNHDDAIRSLRAQLSQSGLSDNEINDELNNLYDSDEMYSGN